MIKIFISVKNRLEITKKCIQSLKRYSTIPHQIYVYDNDSSYKVEEHFNYFYDQYKKGNISQVTFTTEDSTFNAFSKASTSNFFGLQHEMDPKKNKYDFLVILDNDIVVMPEWDKKLHIAWDYVNKQKLNHIKIITQLYGGMSPQYIEHYQITEDMKGSCGTKGGSGLWSVRTNFFRDVGYLDLEKLVGKTKMHDQFYWYRLEEMGIPYIMGLSQKLGIHCGKIIGSVCYILENNKNNLDKNNLIKFKESEEKIGNQGFDEFFDMICKNEELVNHW